MAFSRAIPDEDALAQIRPTSDTASSQIGQRVSNLELWNGAIARRVIKNFGIRRELQCFLWKVLEPWLSILTTPRVRKIARSAFASFPINIRRPQEAELVDLRLIWRLALLWLATTFM
jgi:hypothetical protein